MKRFFSILAVLCLLGLFPPAVAQEPPKDYLKLETAIALAREHNGQLKLAAHNQAQAEAKLGEARAVLWPQFDVTVAYTETDAEPASFSIPGLPPLTMPGNPPYTTQLSVSQPLFVDPLRVQYQMAQKTLALRRLEYEESLEQVTFNVTNAYFQVVKARMGRNIAQRSLAQAESNLRTSQASLTAGILTRNQVLQVELAVANARQGALRASNLYELALAGLRMMIGLEQATAIEVAPDIGGAPAAFTEEPPPATVESRYDVQKAGLAVDMAGLGVRMAKAGYYPVASLSLSYVARDQAPTLANGTTSATVAIKWSWSVGGKTAFTIRAAEEDWARAGDAYQLCRDNGNLEIIQSHLEWVEAKRRLELTALALTVAQENLRLATRRYELGAGTPQEATDARLGLEQAEVNDLNARYDLVLSGLKLTKALGLYHQNNTGDGKGK